MTIGNQSVDSKRHPCDCFHLRLCHPLHQEQQQLGRRPVSLHQKFDNFETSKNTLEHIFIGIPTMTETSFGIDRLISLR